MVSALAHLKIVSISCMCARVYVWLMCVHEDDVNEKKLTKEKKIPLCNSTIECENALINHF